MIHKHFSLPKVDDSQGLLLCLFIPSTTCLYANYMCYEVLNVNKIAAKKEKLENYIVLNYKNGWHRLCTDVVRYTLYIIKYTECNLFYMSIYPSEKPRKNRGQISTVIIFRFRVMEDFPTHEEQNYIPISFYN